MDKTLDRILVGRAGFTGNLINVVIAELLVQYKSYGRAIGLETQPHTTLPLTTATCHSMADSLSRLTATNTLGKWVILYLELCYLWVEVG